MASEGCRVDRRQLQCDQRNRDRAECHLAPASAPAPGASRQRPPLKAPRLLQPPRPPLLRASRRDTTPSRACAHRPAAGCEPRYERLSSAEVGRDSARARREEPRRDLRRTSRGATREQQREADSGGSDGHAQRPNQRALRVDPNSCFSRANSTAGSWHCASGLSPRRKLTSTLPTSPSPNSA